MDRRYIWTAAGMGMFELICGDCRDVMAGMAEASIDAIVTDPPYLLEFMGKSFDKQHRAMPGANVGQRMQAWHYTWAVEAFRVLKPGGHLLAFGGSRTYHRLASAIEDAGFEIRDQIQWLYGSGFPKSRNISAAIDAEAARQWDGWGTALKPACEPIVLARKPLSEATVAANVLKHGTGGLNVDGCRVETCENLGRFNNAKPIEHRVNDSHPNAKNLGRMQQTAAFIDNSTGKGRWPANVIHDGSAEVEAAFAAFGQSKSPASYQRATAGEDAFTGVYGRNKPRPLIQEGFGDSGTASRFFVKCAPDAPEEGLRFRYEPKASRADRDDGLDGMPAVRASALTGRAERSAGLLMDDGTRPNGKKNPYAGTSGEVRRNTHPTVKPTELCRWLVRLITPRGGTVLDPFAGSGSTGRGAVLEGLGFVGIEQSQEWVDVAQRRIQAVVERAREKPSQRQASFDGM